MEGLKQHKVEVVRGLSEGEDGGGSEKSAM